jgi:hypothetical protein
MVDLSGSSLNFLTEFVRKMRPPYEAINNPINTLEREGEEFYSAGTEAAAPPPPAEFSSVPIAVKKTSKRDAPEGVPKVSALLLSRYNRKELYRMVWQKPVRKLALELKICRETLSFICKRLQIPMPGKHYWKRNARLEEKDWPPLPEIQVVGYVKVQKRRI